MQIQNSQKNNSLNLSSNPSFGMVVDRPLSKGLSLGEIATVNGKIADIGDRFEKVVVEVLENKKREEGLCLKLTTADSTTSETEFKTPVSMPELVDYIVHSIKCLYASSVDTEMAINLKSKSENLPSGDIWNALAKFGIPRVEKVD